MSKKSVFILLFAIPTMVSFSAFQETDEITSKVILDVPLEQQQTKMWCWAACTQMILSYTGETLSQCDQVNDRLNRSDCCDTPTLQPCIKGGWPQFYRFGFSSDSIDAALSWEQLKTEIDNNRPVAFSWRWKFGGGHMMVATGYGQTDTRKWVYVNNPFPTLGSKDKHKGEHQVITYDEYISSTTHDHWRDYYNIKPRPEVTTETEEVPIETEIEGPSAEIEVAEVSTSAPSQEVTESTLAFVPYDQKPEPIGGYQAIQRLLKYPEEARRARQKGRAVINVLVNKEGEVVDTKVLQSSGSEVLDEAAATAIKSLRWKPAMQRDKPVDVWVAIPINFKMR